MLVKIHKEIETDIIRQEIRHFFWIVGYIIHLIA